MTERILQIKDAVIRVLAIENAALNTLTQHDWDLLEQSLNILKLFHIVTEEVSAQESHHKI